MHVVTALVLLLAVALPQARTPDYAALRAEAERSYAEGSYARALAAYERAAPLAPTPAERRWADFRLADALWRSEAATSTPDSTKLDDARARLETLAGEPARAEDRDLVWAEAHESLGDWHWARRDLRDWGGAWPHYQAALDWWAGRSDLDLARARYLGVVWKASDPPGRNEWETYAGYANLPVDVLENALRVAVAPGDRARASYLLGVTLSRSGDWEQALRADEVLAAAVAGGKGTGWYDDALWAYTEFLSQTGRAVAGADGAWRREVDYDAALALYRRLTTEFAKGATRYYDQAVQRIGEITMPQVSVAVGGAFLPGSEVAFESAWRNVARVDFAVYPVDLSADPRFAAGSGPSNDWLTGIDLGGRRPAKTWSRETTTSGHVPGHETVRLDATLSPGAYVVEATAGNCRARDLLLVSDALLVLKTSPGGALAFLADARTGEPIAGARVGILTYTLETADGGSRYAPVRREAVTGSDGVARAELGANGGGYQVFAGAAAGARQAFAVGGRSALSVGDQWRIYALSDRPAYRPGETAQWKIVARVHDGETYSTPAGQTVEYEIADPHGAKVAEGTSPLNAFGSAWGALELAAAMPLGEYTVTFYTAGRQRQIGSAALLRLEEYKLPEFRVSVKSPELDGRRRAYRTGERVEVDVEAEYYFGGAVAGATVEAVVYQRPFYRQWRPRGEFDWLADRPERQAYYGGRGEVVKRETLRTDLAGRARLVFDTPRGAQQDFEYQVEARVVDASRREVVASEVVRVARQRFFADLRPEHNIYRPADTVRVKLKTLDANDQPVAATGAAKVTRDVWTEVWVDARGRVVAPELVRRARLRGGGVPAGWRITSQSYVRSEILKTPVATDAAGDGELTFAADREGYYSVEWAAPERNAPPVRAAAVVRVATEATSELGYHTGGLELVVDKETLRPGQSAPVIVHTAASGRWVLFTVEASDVLEYRVARVEGTAKVFPLALDERHAPNVFLTATSVSDLQVLGDLKEVTVPPVRSLLTVDVRADRALYRPRDEGTLEVTTRDSDGRPVAAEVALGLTDESVYAIQEDYAKDPRKWFFGERRQRLVSDTNTAQQKPYLDLVAGENGALIDRRTEATARRARDVARAEGSALADLASSKVATSIAKEEFDVVPRQLNLGSRVDVAPGVRGPVNGRDFAVDGASGAANELVLGGVEVTRVEDGQLGTGAAVVVRSDFRSTAFWQPDVVTDASGRATVRVKLPDSLTTWRAVARAATAASQFGQATSSARTNQPLTVRLQGPRFFVAGDRATVSAVINNDTDAPIRAGAKLEAGGLSVEAVLAPGPNGVAREVAYSTAGLGEYGASADVPAHGEARVDWVASARGPGPVALRVSATAGGDSDSMERSFVAYEHGIDKLVARSGRARTGDAAFTLDLPAGRKAGTTSLVVQVAPSMAVTMLDALPYLIDFPYGCTEQTMSRFLPTVITEKTLGDLGVAPGTVETRLFGGVEPGSAAATHPKGKRDLDRIGEMTTAGLRRLYDFQHDDGGWGWWKEGESDHFMSAYVVWGLVLARDAGVEVDADALEKGVEFLRGEIVEEELQVDSQAWMLHALAAYHHAEHLDEPEESERDAVRNLWEKRDALNASSRALFALAAHDFGMAEEAAVLARNLENGAAIDRAPDTTAVEPRAGRGAPTAQATAHWGADGIAWRWSDSPVEATAFALRALLAIDPKSPLVEPVTNWLVRNRRGAQWSNTRDTAVAVLALNDYLRVSGELSAGLDYEVLVNGASVATKSLTPAEAVAAPARIAVDAALVRDGANDVRVVRRGGTAPIYWAAEARFVSTEEPVTPAGNELFVRRDYYRLAPRETLLKGFVYDRAPLGERAEVRSGDRVEVVLTVEAKNDAEYLIFEDLKPAGLEAVDLRSGGELYARRVKSGAFGRTGARDESDYAGEQRWVHRELRDRTVALFLDKMPQGVWEIRYELRAEVPGSFHGLPLLGQAMYVPEVRANGAEARFVVTERAPR